MAGCDDESDEWKQNTGRQKRKRADPSNKEYPRSKPANDRKPVKEDRVRRAPRVPKEKIDMRGY